jgi:hypothetical protein
MTARLAHGGDFLDRYTEDYHRSGKRDAALLALVADLGRRGAPAHCHVISEADAVDGRVLPLSDALDATFGLHATLLVCVPGRLAVHLPEPPASSVILSKPAGGYTYLRPVTGVRAVLVDELRRPALHDVAQACSPSREPLLARRSCQTLRPMSRRKPG